MTAWIAPIAKPFKNFPPKKRGFVVAVTSMLIAAIDINRAAAKVYLRPILSATSAAPREPKIALRVVYRISKYSYVARDNTADLRCSRSPVERGLPLSI